MRELYRIYDQNKKNRVKKIENLKKMKIKEKINKGKLKRLDRLNINQK